MRGGLLFAMFRLIGIARALVRAWLFLVALRMLALGLQPLLLLLAVIQGRSGKSDIEISGGEIIGARIVFFRAQRFLEPFDRIRSDRLDRKERTRRRSARGFRAILIQQREPLFNTHDTRHAPPAFSARAAGSPADDLARTVEKRAARTSRVDVDVRHDGVRLDLADDAGGDELIAAGRAAGGEHALAFLCWGFASPRAIQRRGRSVWQGGDVHR